MADIRLSGLGVSYTTGTTANRPASPAEGTQYFNTTTGGLQVYLNGQWITHQKPVDIIAPTNVTATDQGSGRAYNNGQASVAFTTSELGGLATSYSVTSSPGSFTNSGTSSPIIITGLQSSTQYAYSVTASNSYSSATSTASSGVTTTTVPQAPTISATGLSQSANITITPGATGGSAITQYTITSDPVTTTQTTSNTTYTFTGLTDGTSYTFTATATNANGTSAASATSNSVTPNSWSPEGAYDALATVSLSAAAESVTFSGIPTGYKHLELRLLAQNSRNSTANGFLTLQFNGAYGERYHYLVGNGATSYAAAGVPALSEGYVVNVSGTVTSTYGAGIINVLDYSSNSKNKTIRILSGNDCNGSGLIGLSSYLVNNTNPITSITLLGTDGANITVNSHFALYGVK